MSSEWTASDLIGGSICLDFANTLGGYRKAREIERLETYANAIDWARAAGLVSADESATLSRLADAAPDAASAELGRLKRLRDAIYGVCSAKARGAPAGSGDIDRLRQATIVAMASARLDAERGWTIELASAGLGTIRARVGLAAFSLGGELATLALKECGRCPWLFIDSSKNRRRLWCDSATCGNRARSERHYHRAMAQAAGQPA
jgi:predicted RNA-binding Zn ribbon-like protein